MIPAVPELLLGQAGSELSDAMFVMAEGPLRQRCDRADPESALYPYTSHLVSLAGYRLRLPTGASERCCEIVSPLNRKTWSSALEGHPDSRLVDYMYVLQGIREGFQI